MEEFVMIDDDYCANCSSFFNNTINCQKVYNLDIVVHVLKENKTLLSCEKISIFAALKHLFNFQLHQNPENEGDPLTSNNNSNARNTVSIDIPLCLPCSLLLQDLYKSLKLLKSVWDESCYISRVHEKIQQSFLLSPVESDNSCYPFENEDQVTDPFCEVKPSSREAESHHFLFPEEPKPEPTPIPLPINVGNFEVPNDLQIQPEKTSIKTEFIADVTLENSIQMQEEMIQATIMNIAAEVVPPLNNNVTQNNSNLLPLTSNISIVESEANTEIDEDFESVILDTQPSRYQEVTHRSQSYNFHKKSKRITGSEFGTGIRNRAFRMGVSVTGKRRKQFKCRFCDFWAYSANVVTHERIHTGEKPFACTYPGCTFRSRHSTNLTKHMLIHSQEGRFPCNFCSFKGKHESTLTKHLRRYHTES